MLTTSMLSAICSARHTIERCNLERSEVCVCVNRWVMCVTSVTECAFTVPPLFLKQGGEFMTWSLLKLRDFVWRWLEMLPHFLLSPLGNSPHSFLLAWLKTESQAQWNNCTKYSPAVTIETSTGASLTSPTVSHFALDPEKHWEVGV